MASFDVQYQNLVRILIDKADNMLRLSPNRTGIPSVKIPGYEIRVSPEDGFPLLGLKATPFKLIAHEDFWFLRGDTSNNSLVAVGAYFWDHWALRLKDIVQYLGVHRPVEYGTILGAIVKDVDRLIEPEDLLANYYDLEMDAPVDNDTLRIDSLGIRIKRAFMLRLVAWFDNTGTRVMRADRSIQVRVSPDGKNAYVEIKYIGWDGKIDTVREGDLGPIYGKQWRDFNGIDQIADLVQTLKTNPMSRRMVTSAWNPEVLPDESISPQFNVIEGRAALASCHYAFTCVCEELGLDERIKMGLKQHADHPDRVAISERIARANLKGEDVAAVLTEVGVPKHKLHLIFNMRSSDVGLGLPFNMAGYALLQRMLASHVGMAIGDVVYQGEDVHCYQNHIEEMRKLLELDATAIPPVQLNIKEQIASFDPDAIYDINNFEIVGYKPYGKLTLEAAV